MEPDTSHLRVEDVSLSFGGLNALSNVSLEVRQGEIPAIIGPNGAGKTSLLNCINGFYRPDRGAIAFEDQEITRLPPYKIAALGISRTFQNIALYTGMSVLDNLMAARHVHMKHGMLAGALYFGRALKEELEHRLVMENGRVVLDGPAEALRENEDIKEFYLGLTRVGERKSYRDVKHYKRRKRWLG